MAQAVRGAVHLVQARHAAAGREARLASASQLRPFKTCIIDLYNI